MADWTPVVALAIGAVMYFVRQRRIAQKNAPPKLQLRTSYRGRVVGGESLLSPGQVPCVAFGVVLSNKDSESDEMTVEHRGGWTQGLEVRTSDNEIIVIPKGAIHVDGSWNEAHGQGVYAYLADIGLVDEKRFQPRIEFNHLVEALVEVNNHVTISATDFSAEMDDSQRGMGYRDGRIKRIAQGDIHVEVGEDPSFYKKA